jgi:L-ribulokinase
MTLATRPPDIYRALVEATAFGTRVIVEAFERAGLPVGEIVACGGLPDRSPFVMQVFADVTGREIAVAGSRQAPALGAAMFGAVAAGAAAGGHDSIVDAAHAMAHLSGVTYTPRVEHREAYDILYGEYVRLHDLFGRDGDDVMRRLKRLQSDAATPAPAPA